MAKKNVQAAATALSAANHEAMAGNSDLSFPLLIPSTLTSASTSVD